MLIRLISNSGDNMKIKTLVATKRGQGQRANDFSHTEEGEPVSFPMIECTGEKPDDNCGCARSFSGNKTARATTTAEVREADITALVKQRAEFLAKHWSMKPAEALSEAAADVRQMAECAEMWAVGTVVEKRGDVVKPRAIKAKGGK